MKAITLLFALAGGAGFLFRNQVQSWVHSPHHQAPEGVYYLRTSYTFPAAGGVIRWSPGQEVRTASDTVAAHGFVTLTDGVNTSEVPQTAVTSDMDDAVALRQLDASNQNTVRSAAERETNSQAAAARQAEAARQTEAAQQAEAARQANSNRLVSGQFHTTTLDAPAVPTNQPQNIVSTASAPVFYPVYGTVYVERGTQVRQGRGTSGGTVVAAPQRVEKPVHTPPPFPKN